MMAATPLLVDADSRITTRWIILRAMSGSVLVNDYRLRIIAGSGLQNPGLRFTDAVDTLTPAATHSFVATSDSSEAITYSVTAIDDSPTTLASINSGTGELTTTDEGVVKVTATVAAEGTTWRGATTQHIVTLARLPANLTFITAPERLRTGSDQTAQFNVSRDGAGDVTWSIVEGTPAAMIDGDGLVTAGTTPETITIQAVVRPNPNPQYRNHHHPPGH